MAFQKAVLLNIAKEKNTGGSVIALDFHIQIYDTAVANQCRSFSYKIAGSEFTFLPAGAAAKKAAIKTILKREVKAVHAQWINVEIGKNATRKLLS